MLASHSSRSRVLRAACTATTLLALLAPAAQAAPPVAAPDTLQVSLTGVNDVLLNDSDPDNDPLTVTGTTQPAHGAVTCSALGACFYSALAGFVGADSFQYTARDTHGETATGTVAVTITAQTSATTVIARDDEGATAFGQPLTLNVLANDLGDTLQLTSSTSPQHGTATCTADGSCHYTPATGFSGSDAFTYAISNGGALHASGAAQILVAPAGAGYGLTIDGRPESPAGGAVPAGGTAWWDVGLAATPAGISSRELGALPSPAGSATLEGPQARGEVRAARGWTVADAAGGVQFQAGADALLGDGLTQSFPRPLPPIKQGTGGDGHVPIVVGSKVFAFYHLAFPTSVTCIDQATGSSCPGYPKVLDGFSGLLAPGPAVVVGARIYTHLGVGPPYDGIAANHAQRSAIGLFCWDAATNSTCGLTIVDRLHTSISNPFASAPVLIAGKMWFGADTGKLYCVDPASGEPCAVPSLDTGLAVQTVNPGEYDIVTHGTRVFLATSAEKRVACIDVAARASCPGWSSPKPFGVSASTELDVVNWHDGNGDIIGVCVFWQPAKTEGSCLRDSDPSTSTPVANWPLRHTQFGISQEADVGTRTFVGNGASDPGIACYDWATMAPCTGEGYDANGLLTTGDDGPLPSAYGVAFDGTCLIALGDPGLVFTADPAGYAPCLRLRKGDLPHVDLRDQRCDATVGSSGWQSVQLADAADGEMRSVVATVRDATSGAVLKSGQLVGNDGRLDLSGIDPAAHPSVTVDARARSAPGAHAWDDGIPPRITLTWHPDAHPICFRAATTTECSATSPTPLGGIAALSTPGVFEARGSLNLLRAPCKQAVKPEVKAAIKTRRCEGLRRFKIHVRYAGKKVRRITVTVGKTKQHIVTLRPRPVAQIDLRRLPIQTTRVKIEIKTKSGKTIKGTRVYHPCHLKLPDRGFSL